MSDTVVIGNFFVTPCEPKPSKVYLQRKDGPYAGEGGEFDMAELARAIEDFYNKNF